MYRETEANASVCPMGLTGRSVSNSNSPDVAYVWACYLMQMAITIVIHTEVFSLIHSGQSLRPTDVPATRADVNVPSPGSLNRLVGGRSTQYLSKSNTVSGCLS